MVGRLMEVDTLSTTLETITRKTKPSSRESVCGCAPRPPSSPPQIGLGSGRTVVVRCSQWRRRAGEEQALKLAMHNSLGIAVGRLSGGHAAADCEKTMKRKKC